MTLTEFNRHLSDATGLTRIQASKFTTELFRLLRSTLEKDEPLRIPFFGIFTPYLQKPKIFYHPKTREALQLPAYKRIRLKISPHFRDRLRNSW